MGTGPVRCSATRTRSSPGRTAAARTCSGRKSGARRWPRHREGTKRIAEDGSLRHAEPAHQKLKGARHRQGGR